MSFILNINTAGEVAQVFVSSNGNPLSSRENRLQADHASFLHPAIADICNETGIEMNSLDAVAVCNGPGSYTGIRVGVSSAKGLALALKKPLVMVDALSILAMDAINNTGKMDALYCPMIDARRMEVYFALFDCDLNHKISPSSIIVDENTFKDEGNEIFFLGSGSQKFKPLFKGKGTFLPEVNTIKAFSQLSQTRFIKKEFSDLIYSDAFYVKEFHDSSK